MRQPFEKAGSSTRTPFIIVNGRLWPVDPGIDREGRYRRVIGPPYEIGKTAAHEA